MLRMARATSHEKEKNPQRRPGFCGTLRLKCRKSTCEPRYDRGSLRLIPKPGGANVSFRSKALTVREDHWAADTSLRQSTKKGGNILHQNFGNHRGNVLSSLRCNL